MPKIIYSVGDNLNQMIYKSRFKSFPMTYDFDLNQFFWPRFVILTNQIFNDFNLL